ncbi:MAG TPA: nuclear transport factor 2 family protein [Pyrinomonadaceae bacterium]|nr:nuclear transport factor 2 family protein [Pyrinomonadaceae bacterium]
MKRCSTCNRTYTDPNLSFCIDDGTPLTPINYEDETTVVSPRNTDDNWNAVAYQPPGPYVPPGTDPSRPRRRVWPWVLGIAGAFILGIVAISIAAAILAPRLLRSARNQQHEAAPKQQREIPNTNTSPENANVAEPPVNTNANANASVAVPPPADRELVLAQLTGLEHDWTVANLNADKKALERILADDYVGPTSEGAGLQTKADYIRTIERDTNVQKWEFNDLKVMLTGDRATLTGKITYQTKDQDLGFVFTDKFVWRDGRWQATGSQVTPRE